MSLLCSINVCTFVNNYGIHGFLFLKYCNIWENAQKKLRIFLSLRVHTLVEINENFAKIGKILSFVDSNAL